MVTVELGLPIWAEASYFLAIYDVFDGDGFF